MYPTLLAIHGIFRWAALILLLIATYRAWRGYTLGKIFSKGDNSTRHWTATVIQVQMVVGFVLYNYSPFAKSFWSDASVPGDGSMFFAIIHATMMFAAVIIVSIGSAMAKRRPTDHEKYKTMLTWFAIALLVILVAIPWPFSPFAQRPLIRL